MTVEQLTHTSKTSPVKLRSQRPPLKPPETWPRSKLSRKFNPFVSEEWAFELCVCQQQQEDRKPFSDWYHLKRNVLQDSLKGFCGFKAECLSCLRVTWLNEKSQGDMWKRSAAREDTESGKQKVREDGRVIEAAPHFDLLSPSIYHVGQWFPFLFLQNSHENHTG